MAQLSVTQAGTYAESEGAALHVTQAGTYAEIDGAQVSVTVAGIYAEITKTEILVTAAGVYVEIEPPSAIGRPTTHYEYNGVDITDYCNAIDLEISTAEHINKRLDSTAMRAVAGLTTQSVRLKGDWNATIDGLLGKDAFAKHWRDGVVSFRDGIQQIDYTWTATVQVQEWRVSAAATGKIEFSCTLRHNGLGVRSVTAS